MKNVIVTGGTRGIGLGIARMLQKNGYRVICTGRNETHELTLREGRDYWRCDISSGAHRAELLDHVRQSHGRLDGLVNNAGVAPALRRDVLEMTEESMDQVMNVNLKGTFFLSQAAANYMLECRQRLGEEYQPRIVNIGSISAYTSSISRGEYCISKAGVGMVTMLLADRLAAEGIPVFEVRPGIIETDMTARVHEKYQALIDGGLLPIKRFGKPEDVAKMVLACFSGLLDYAAGQVLNADGGFALRRL